MPNRAILWVVCFLGLAVSLIGFQNCSTGYQTSSSSGNSAASSPSTLSSPVPGAPEAFTAGSAFNYALVQQQSQMVSVQLQDTNYLASSLARAVAINAKGLGFVSTVQDNDQNEANQIAIEACFAIGGSQPCALLAIAGNFAMNASDLNWSSSYSSAITSSTSVTGPNILFLPFADRGAAAYGYINAQSPKAMAISIDGTYMVASANGNFGTLTDSRKLATAQLNVPASDTEASRMALEMCEMTSKYLPCQLFALNKNVVLNPAHFNYMPVINYQPTTITAIPGISSAVFAANFAAGLSTMSYSYISADGDFGNNGTMTAAQSQCSTAQSISNSGTYACFEYAQGASPVSLIANLTAVKAHSLTTHCKVMPRTSCAAHAAVGCTGGTFYVVQNGIVQLSTCP